MENTNKKPTILKVIREILVYVDEFFKYLWYLTFGPAIDGVLLFSPFFRFWSVQFYSF